MDFLEAFLDFFDKYPWMPFVLVIGGIILHIIIKDQIGKKKAKTGKDKEKIHNILKSVMGENATYVPVYATRVEHRANSRAYYYYAGRTNDTGTLKFCRTRGGVRKTISDSKGSIRKNQNRQENGCNVSIGWFI